MYYLNKRKVENKITQNELTVNILQVTYAHTNAHPRSLGVKERYEKKSKYNSNRAFVTSEVLNLAGEG